MKRINFLIRYAGYMTAVVTFMIYLFLMWHFTEKDLLEIIVTYAIFLYLPSVGLPFLIAGGEYDEDTK